MSPHGVDVASDLTALAFPDGAFDAAYCSHVLEHVPDDRAAMRELHRFIRPGGFAVIQVPTRGDETYEDFGITTPQDGLQAFGQKDHVRVYGLDVTERVRSAGFQVSALRVRDIFTEDEIRRHRLESEEILFRCDREDGGSGAGRDAGL